MSRSNETFLVLAITFALFAICTLTSCGKVPEQNRGSECMGGMSVCTMDEGTKDFDCRCHGGKKKEVSKAENIRYDVDLND